MRHYQGDIGGALLHVYPDIGLEPTLLRSGKSFHPSSFTSYSPSVIQTTHSLFLSSLPSDGRSVMLGKHRAFFTSFAAQQGFDPLVAQNWYSTPKSLVMKHKVSFLPSLPSTPPLYLISFFLLPFLSLFHSFVFLSFYFILSCFVSSLYLSLICFLRAPKQSYRTTAIVYVELYREYFQI